MASRKNACMGAMAPGLPPPSMHTSSSPAASPRSSMSWTMPDPWVRNRPNLENSMSAAESGTGNRPASPQPGRAMPSASVARLAVVRGGAGVRQASVVGLQRDQVREDVTGLLEQYVRGEAVVILDRHGFLGRDEIE